MNLIIIMFFALVHNASGMSSGSNKDNGGSIISCNSNTLSGIYTTDYIIGLSELKELESIDPTTLKESLDHVEAGLKRNLPKLLDRFRKFRSQIFKRADWSQERGYGWESDNQSLNVLQKVSEGLRRKLPKYCKNVEQAVRREVTGEITVFHYDSADIERLRVKPLQLSYLLVHEWLWENVYDSDSLRRLNKILHSTDFRTMNEKQAKSLLWNAGFFGVNCVPRTALISIKNRDNFCESYLKIHPVSREIAESCRAHPVVNFTDCLQMSFLYRTTAAEMRVCTEGTFMVSSLKFCLKAFFTAWLDPNKHLTIDEVKYCASGFSTPFSFRRCVNGYLEGDQ